MDVSEIVDRDSFQRWLETLPQRTDAEREQARRWAVLLAHRAAMRVLPEFWAWSVVQTNRKHTVLPVFRANLTSSLSLAMPFFPAPTLLEMERAAYPDEAISGGAFNASSAGIAAAKALSSTIEPGPNLVDAHFAVSASETAIKASFSFVSKALGPAYFWSGVRTDCSALLSGKDPLLLPLWPAENPLAEQWSTIRAHPSTQTPGWRFWIDWYERALTGQPQDWALLEKVALIDPKDWDKGADHVNALILQMIEQHELLLETQRLKAENERLVEHLRALEQRSHNNPPELVDDLAPIRTGTTIIWAALDDAERELGKTKPDKSALRKAAEALLTGSKAIGGYCLRLADTVAQGAARAAGAAIVAGLGIAGLLSSFNADLATLADTLLRFAASLIL